METLAEERLFDFALLFDFDFDFDADLALLFVAALGGMPLRCVSR
jgi:hypothetical protein